MIDRALVHCTTSIIYCYAAEFMYAFRDILQRKC